MVAVLYLYKEVHSSSDLRPEGLDSNPATVCTVEQDTCQHHVLGPPELDTEGGGAVNGDGNWQMGQD